MADYAFNGSEHINAQIPISLDTTTNLGNVFSLNTTWSGTKTGGNETRAANTLYTAVLNATSPGTYYKIWRTFLQFKIPNNLARVDIPPQLKIYSNLMVGTSTIRIVPTSVNNTNFVTPWENGTPSTVWDSVYIGSGASAAKYIDGNYHTVSGTGQQTINLNMLAGYHCTKGAHVSGGIKYITICIVEHTYDWSDTAIANDTVTGVYFDDYSDSNPPQLILKSPWFVNTSDAIQQYDGDFVINAHDPNLNQHDKRVAQTPFGLNLKGPISLRNTNRAYKTTKSK